MEELSVDLVNEANHGLLEALQQLRIIDEFA